MSSPMRLSLVAAAFLCPLWAGAGAAHAAVQCPAASGGRPLRAAGGGDLYEGPVQDNATLAPRSSRQGSSGWVNTWQLPGGAGFTLVCRYEGTAAVVALPLTPEIRGCRQDARSFVCQ